MCGRLLASALLWLAMPLCSHAAPEPARLHGRDLDPEGALGLAAVAVAADAHGITRTVLELSEPRIDALDYAIEGIVETDGVEGAGYLEMWSHFPDGAAYFSRTLGGSGPMARLQGSQAPRPFALPFHLDRGGARPTRLVVNVVLPASGRVALRDLRFVNGESLGGAWWSDRQAGLIGGVLGSCIGVLGALVGTLCSVGLGRRLVLGVLYSMIAFGIGALGLGLLALALGQPYAVWYPPLLLGAVCAAVPPGLLRTVRGRFDAARQGGPRRLASP